MAFRTWAKLLGATLGVAALAGASQLGVAYGLGILRLTRVLDVPTRDQWTAQLAWVAWFAMMSAVLGALAGGWLLERWRGSVTVGTHIALSLAAGLGAAVVVPLTMQPARTAQITGVDPVFVIGLCAGLGALVGACAAYAALAQPVARWSLGIVGLIIWVVAIVAVIAVVPLLPAARLGVFDVGFAPSVTQRTALFTMPALALLVGAALGWAARRREMPTMTIALAGLPGPALLTVAYLIAGPGSGDERYQVVPYWAAMTATGAGVLGSVLAAVLRKGEEAEGTGDLATDDVQKTEPTGLSSPTAAPSKTPPDSGNPDQRPSPGQPSSARTTPDRPAPDRPAADQPTSQWPAAGRRPDPSRPDPGRQTDSGRQADSGRQTDSGGLGVTPPGDPRARVADALGSRTAERQPTPFDRPGTAGSVPLGDYTQQEPEPFDAFAPAAKRRTNPNRRPAAAPEPYVPAPAIPPMPPGAIQEPSQSAGGRLGRTRNPFSRNRARPDQDTPQIPEQRPEFRPAPPEPTAAPATWPGRNELPTERPPSRAPLVPEPHAVSAPLPQPDPITPPLTVTPAPEPDQRRGKKKGRDDDYVDWVSGLGT